MLHVFASLLQYLLKLDVLIIQLKIKQISSQLGSIENVVQVFGFNGFNQLTLLG